MINNFSIFLGVLLLATVVLQGVFVYFIGGKLFKLQTLLFWQSCLVALVSLIAGCAIGFIFFTGQLVLGIFGIFGSYAIFYLLLKGFVYINWRKSIWIFIIYCIFTLAFILLIILPVKKYLVSPVYIVDYATESEKGKYIFVEKMTKSFKKGDIIVYNYYPLSYDSERRASIRRIIGIPYELVEINDGIVYVNDISYGEWNSEIKDYYVTQLQLSENEYLILPDDRQNIFGDLKTNVIDKRFIVGKVIATDFY